MDRYLSIFSISISLIHLNQTEIQIDADNNYYEVSTYPTSAAGPSASSKTQGKKALEKAEINLNDCLACRYA